jgi:hypothetical protein
MSDRWTVKVWVSRLLAGLVVLGALPPAAGAAAQGPPGGSQPARASKVVVIDGSVTPEAIPDHWVWRDAFYFLEMAKRRDLGFVFERLALSGRELAIVVAEAAAQPARDEACGKRIEAHREALVAQGASGEALTRAFVDDTLECRQRDLEARDRVLRALGSDGQFQLRMWIEEHRRTLKVTVPADELELFRRPQ